LKAVCIHEQDGADRLRFEDCPEPELSGVYDAIVKLEYASINRRDIGSGCDTIRTLSNLPRILGPDGAGVVAAVGGEGKSVKPNSSVRSSWK
jgi:NADPH:quinone reductase-like Zn-dependent oxidoreductase